MLFAGAGLTAVNFVNILFSILIGQFLSLNPLLNAGGRHEIGGILKASILSSVVLRKHGIFRVSSIRSLDFIDDLFDVWWRWVGKCESFSIPLFILQPVLSYFPSFFISIYNKVRIERALSSVERACSMGVWSIELSYSCHAICQIGLCPPFCGIFL